MGPRTRTFLVEVLYLAEMISEMNSEIVVSCLSCLLFWRFKRFRIPSSRPKAPSLFQHLSEGTFWRKWMQRTCKPARQTTESIQIYPNIPGSSLPRFSCQIIHVGAKNIKIYGQTNPDTNIMNLMQKLFSEFLKLNEGIQIRKTPTKHDHTLPKYQR